MILGREQARLQEELELTRRQVSQIAHVMQVRLKCLHYTLHLMHVCAPTIAKHAEGLGQYGHLHVTYHQLCWPGHT